MAGISLAQPATAGCVGFRYFAIWQSFPSTGADIIATLPFIEWIVGVELSVVDDRRYSVQTAALQQPRIEYSEQPRIEFANILSDSSFVEQLWRVT